MADIREFTFRDFGDEVETKWRVASYEEVAKLAEEPGAPHVQFGCIECGKAPWSAKNLTLTPSGHYNGVRNIFWHGHDAECKCNPARLRCIVPA